MDEPSIEQLIEEASFSVLGHHMVCKWRVEREKATGLLAEFMDWAEGQKHVQKSGVGRVLRHRFKIIMGRSSLNRHLNYECRCRTKPNQA